MKRFLIALAVGALTVFGSANAALLNFFEFGDKTFSTSTLVADTPLNSTLLFLENPTASTGLNPTGLDVGLAVANNRFGPAPARLTVGSVVYDAAAANNVTFQSFLPFKVNGSGNLPGGTFALGLWSGNSRVDLQAISAVNNVPGTFRFDFAGGSYALLGDVTQVPIPAAGLLFLSAIGGLLLLARRNRARNNSLANRGGEPLPA
jgi:hypothetical protein